MLPMRLHYQHTIVLPTIVILIVRLHTILPILSQLLPVSGSSPFSTTFTVVIAYFFTVGCHHFKPSPLDLYDCVWSFYISTKDTSLKVKLGWMVR